MPTGAGAHQQGTDGHCLPEPTLEGALIFLVFLLPGWSSQEDKRLSTTALALCNCFLLGGSWLLESPSGDLIGREPGLECGQTTFLLASGAFSLALRVHTQRRERARGGPPKSRVLQDWGPSALRVSWCFVPLFFVPRGQGSPILGDLGAFVSSGMAAKEIWVCAEWGAWVVVFQGVLKISDCSSTSFNLCRGRWQVPVYS